MKEFAEKLFQQITQGHLVRPKQQARDGYDDWLTAHLRLVFLHHWGEVIYGHLDLESCVLISHGIFCFRGGLSECREIILTCCSHGDNRTGVLQILPQPNVKWLTRSLSGAHLSKSWRTDTTNVLYCHFFAVLFWAKVQLKYLKKREQTILSLNNSAFCAWIARAVFETSVGFSPYLEIWK